MTVNPSRVITADKYAFASIWLTTKGEYLKILAKLIKKKRESRIFIVDSPPLRQTPRTIFHHD